MQCCNAEKISFTVFLLRYIWLPRTEPMICWNYCWSTDQKSTALMGPARRRCIERRVVDIIKRADCCSNMAPIRRSLTCRAKMPRWLLRRTLFEQYFKVCSFSSLNIFDFSSIIVCKAFPTWNLWFISVVNSPTTQTFAQSAFVVLAFSVIQ